MYFFLLAYTILGCGIKYIDAAFDDNTFNKKFALAVAPLLGILWGYTMLINSFSATILLSVLLAVILKRKVDNLALIFGTLTIIMFILIGIIFIDGIELMLLPLIFLTTAGVIDEVGNDIMDFNNKESNRKGFKFHFSAYFFGRRYLMKVALLYLVILGLFPIYFLLAFILFDEGYIIVEIFSMSRQQV
jgi:hypothetical protein